MRLATRAKNRSESTPPSSLTVAVAWQTNS